MRVLVDEAALVFLDQPVDFHRLRDHRRDDAEEFDAAVEGPFGIELQIDSERADRAPVERDGDTDEAQLLVRELGTPRRPVEERRLAAHARHDDRLPALHHPSRNALARAIADGARRFADAVSGFDAEVAVGVDQRHETADRAVLRREDFEHAVQRRLQIEAGERLADIEQRRQPLGLAQPRIGWRDIFVCCQTWNNIFVSLCHCQIRRVTG